MRMDYFKYRLWCECVIVTNRLDWVGLLIGDVSLKNQERHSSLD
jgi:hypothetical protein